MTWWPSEHVPDEDRLFMRVHRCYYPEGQLNTGVFRDHGAGMSTDWEKYSTPTETRDRARSPNENGVISLIARQVRAIPPLVVRHTPDPDTMNRAHTDVIGEKSPRVRIMLSRILRWEIRIPPETCPT